MNKNFWKLVIGITIITSLFVGGLAFAENNITVQLDGKTLNFDVQPQLIGGRTMVPLRTIFESLGATVDWNNDTKTVTAFNELYYVQATINDYNMKVNGETKTLDIPPLLVDGRTLVPARFVAEAFGAKVDWDAKTSTVYIQSELNTSPMSGTEDNNNSFIPVNKVPQNFTDGYEKAVFSKFNSFASENGLGGTKVYLDCIIDRTSFIDSDEGKVIIGYLIDNDNNNWVTLLNGTVFVNEKEYNSVVGKPLVFCGVYDGYSATEKMPYIYLDELCVKETGEIKSGIGKLMSIAENDKIETEVKPKENTTKYDLTTASDLEDYLKDNFGELKTEFITFNLKDYIQVNENEDKFKCYDIAIVIPWSTIEYEYYNIRNSIKYTDEQIKAFEGSINSYLKSMATSAISAMPTKKIRGGFLEAGYKYPNLKMDYYENTIFGWKNYDYLTRIFPYYEDTKITEFHWHNFSGSGAPFDGI